jgi:flagellar basal body-associated protein FliL
LQITFEDSLGKHVLEKNLPIEIQGNQPIIILIAAIIILLVAVAIFSRFRGTKKQPKSEKPAE